MTTQTRRFITEATQRQIEQERARVEREQQERVEAEARISQPLPAQLISQFTTIAGEEPDKKKVEAENLEPVHPAIAAVTLLSFVVIVIIASYYIIGAMNTPRTVITTQATSAPAQVVPTTQPTAAPPAPIGIGQLAVYHAPNIASAAKPIERSEKMTAVGRCGLDWVRLNRENGEPPVWAMVADTGVDPKMVATLRDLCVGVAPSAPSAPAQPPIAAPANVAEEIVTAPAGVTSIRQEFASDGSTLNVPTSTCTYETAQYRATAEVLKLGGGAMAGTPIGTVEGYSCQSMEEARAMASERAAERARIEANP